jgi:hypothetical protein
MLSRSSLGDQQQIGGNLFGRHRAPPGGPRKLSQGRCAAQFRSRAGTSPAGAIASSRYTRSTMCWEHALIAALIGELLPHLCDLGQHRLGPRIARLVGQCGAISRRLPEFCRLIVLHFQSPTHPTYPRKRIVFPARAQSSGSCEPRFSARAWPIGHSAACRFTAGAPPSRLHGRRAGGRSANAARRRSPHALAASHR